ncbi:hypothetical protein BDZ91DRAFT_721667 [Kalaharituber pfeilii]|nr:hypothetical protein BDZ91DRAFT_721667 [Kalaharituber pfeilii]
MQSSSSSPISGLSSCSSSHALTIYSTSLEIYIPISSFCFFLGFTISLKVVWSFKDNDMQYPTLCINETSLPVIRNKISKKYFTIILGTRQL